MEPARRAVRPSREWTATRVEVGHVPARLGARNDPGIAGLARQDREHADRRRRQVDRAVAGLTIDDNELSGIEIDVRPGRGHDLGLAAARQHQQAGGPSSLSRHLTVIARHPIEHLPKRVAGSRPLGVLPGAGFHCKPV